MTLSLDKTGCINLGEYFAVFGSWGDTTFPSYAKLFAWWNISNDENLRKLWLKLNNALHVLLSEKFCSCHEKETSIMQI